MAVGELRPTLRRDGGPTALRVEKRSPFPDYQSYHSKALRCIADSESHDAVDSESWHFGSTELIDVSDPQTPNAKHPALDLSLLHVPS